MMNPNKLVLWCLPKSAIILTVISASCSHSNHKTPSVATISPSDSQDYTLSHEAPHTSTANDIKPLDDDILEFGISSEKERKPSNISQTNQKIDKRKLSPERTYLISSKFVKVRKAPHRRAQVAGKLHRGDEVQVSLFKKGWAKIGDNRWIQRQYIK
jgi:hypothetical protein